ncbi:IucA/IucC family protein [Parendozoicomonas haliclonae]|uniref:N(2)-citryl-N(6)-acetyl-N(6)-hydroxylysine synthase n=1 Tax=Parendozoicomonas haliclonae TaxID=1960125 RepID=A0A1X7ALM9_9GAMM|nr:IucA/IucC family protein [Parendozoicomonas haliclonae]SMA48954.1 N(2)-citryl-N(6)-acetyl-N(6)-hydroxylysine synthase [Parendozoicomonas haliclonae]
MQTHSRSAAEVLAINSFFNALLREWHPWQWRGQNKITLPLLENDGVLQLELEQKGIAGRHRFKPELQHISPDGSEKSIPFLESARLLCKKLAQDKSIHQAAISDFLARVENSVTNTQQTLAERSQNLEALYHQDTTFQESEQGLLAGHSVHPVPKSRTGMNSSDTHLYAPEFGQTFALHWFAIDNRMLSDESAEALSFAQLTRQLAEDDPALGVQFLEGIPEGFTLLPAHPWQARQWLKHESIAQLILDGHMQDFGAHGSHWAATSSMRAVHAYHARHMLKFSLSVKLTNSLRHLLPKEVERGKEIFRALQTQQGQSFSQRFPNFQIIHEPAHACIMDADGQPIAETMVVFRDNPFPKQDSAHIELLATLTQDNPNGDCRLINRLHLLAMSEARPFSAVATDWFKAFLTKVIEPLLAAQYDYGLLFGAHQQNLLIDLTTGYPTRAWFRDCQGTGFSPVAQALFAEVLPKNPVHNEHHISGDIGNKLFTYYLLINTTFGVTGALASSGEIAEKDLLHDLKTFLKKLRGNNPRDTSCLDYMLESDTLQAKGNFFCCLTAINENTLENPLGIYHPMGNPLLMDSSEHIKNKNGQSS